MTDINDWPEFERFIDYALGASKQSSKEEILELVDSGEFGDAFDMAISMIEEAERPIPEQIYNDAKTIGSYFVDQGSPEYDNWDRLSPLVK